MIRHVIVEGCDGTGKTGLITRLTKTLDLPIHTKASTSLGGPLPDIDVWVDVDSQSMHAQTPQIYDRHPLISEPIYAPLARHVPPFGMFQSDIWFTARRHLVARHAVVVVCMPPWSEVRRNVLSDGQAHMPGVAANIRALYDAYKHVQRGWPGPVVWWNYKSGDTGYAALVGQIHSHLKGEFNTDD
jgi:hypothetical protein